MRTRNANYFYMERLILNCDLGEEESTAHTAALLGLVDAANICCGVHAGSLGKTAATLTLAKASQVKVGAHPGLSGAGGRGCELPSPVALRQLLGVQVPGFLAQAAELGVKVDYVKLHGSLYHGVEGDAYLAECYVAFIAELSPPLGIYALAGGCCAELARQRGIRVWAEAFADRAYESNGQLVARQKPGAVLSAQAALQRMQHWLDSGRMPAIDGGDFPLQADTLCVHADSPGALELIHALRAVL